MTTEALVAKTMWALGQTSDPDEIRGPVLPHGEPRPAGGRGLNARLRWFRRHTACSGLVDGARAVERALVEGDAGRPRRFGETPGAAGRRAGCERGARG